MFAALPTAAAPQPQPQPQPVRIAQNVDTTLGSGLQTLTASGATNQRWTLLP